MSGEIKILEYTYTMYGRKIRALFHQDAGQLELF